MGSGCVDIARAFDGGGGLADRNVWQLLPCLPLARSQAAVSLPGPAGFVEIQLCSLSPLFSLIDRLRYIYIIFFLRRCRLRRRRRRCREAFAVLEFGLFTCSMPRIGGAARWRSDLAGGRRTASCADAGWPREARLSKLPTRVCIRVYMRSPRSSRYLITARGLYTFVF